ncbi:MAG TPA: ATP-binding protein [Woeseiaceae bacterium]|nr:ATP-binding protein [Woeseiaceae bacterium]
MKRLGRRSVRAKVLFVVLVTAASALLISGASMVYYELRDFRQTGVHELSAQAAVIGLAAAPALQFLDPEAAHEYLASLAANEDISSAAIYTANGTMFASYSATGQAVSFPELPATDGHYVDGNELVVFQRIVAGGDEIIGTVGLRASHDLGGRLMDYLGILGAVMLLSLVAAALISGWLQRTITQPIAQVTSVARRVMEQRDFSLRAPKSTSDEIGLLVDSFNGMLDELGRRAERLEHSVREQERAEEELRTLNAELEDRVEARTSQLEAANRELESFSYSVSHDLRAPLRAITGFSNLLWEDHRDHLDEEARRKLGIIRGQADRMGALIDDLLRFSRLGRKAIEPSLIDMAELASSAFERLDRDEASGNLEFRVGKLPPAMADRNLMQQVWLNLLSNAVKFSSRNEEAVVEVGAIVEEEENVYYVRDNGAGFDPRYRDKLFGVFQRLHDESEFPGTGVGLALVHRIVARHGGRVWADSRPGEGATFHFSIPRERPDEV